ncbi:wax ester/triacylglycerol synthase family O-acyltransferase [Solimonas sp. K1W22B-7]|uniref:WS/DGAT/MGAT family O-acyltransferase n=1 Tax=Solimonas sp. K1W22B-7 TaxID=2303331 RepID=UPI000E3316D2|nr:wax ester/triacylglycerol synthase family O-acyltransferase [Solimonas sp. K1W22B-7]AXQ30726.1 wax ester/triacylglycerol synthase family O-acyltransferase [Solimonas sp. K1W22B-7]
MKRLAMVDDTFLRFESRRQPLHIGMLMLFEPPAGAGKEFPAQVAERLKQSTRAAPPFNQRLVRRGGLHYWEQDDEFDLAHHFVHLSLPQPGRIRELLAMVSRVHGGHLDRAYPLWRIYLIEGLEDGRFAVYLKIHHSVVDGVAGIRMLINMMSTDAEASRQLPPPWEVGTRRSETNPLPIPTRTAGGLSALRSLTREGLKAFTPVLRELRSSFQDFRAKNADLVVGGQAPRCLLNQQVSGTRRFAAQSYATPRMKAVAKAYNATLNDVILAMCGGALRRYLQDLDELPDKPLVAAVPVSVRRDHTALGNEVAFTLAHLATHLDDPAARIVAIKSCMDYNKERIRRLSPAQLVTYASLMLMPGAVNALLGLTPDKALGNIVISHVPGPRQTMYWQGARLSGLYPASLLIDSAALNITIISRHDTVDFGLIACRKTVPHMQRLLEYLEDALTELEGTIK